MQTSRESCQGSGTIHRLYHQPARSHYNNAYQDTVSSSQATYNEQFFTLESSPATKFVIYNSPSVISTSSNRSPFSPQYSSQSCVSNIHHSPDNIYGSPASGSSSTFINGDSSGVEMEDILRFVESELLGPSSDFEDGSITSFNNGGILPPQVNFNNEIMQVVRGLNLKQFLEFCEFRYDEVMQIVPSLDLSKVLVLCSHAMGEGYKEDVERLKTVLESLVSVSGDPIERLGAYMLEGLKARQWCSGSVLYKKLKCREPTGKELLSYMHVLYEICPYYKFAYTSSNVIIKEAMENETHIHIIDFLIAQGSQWADLINDLANRPNGPPLSIRITGVDDEDSSYAREGEQYLVGQRLANVAAKYGIHFEFHAAAISGHEVTWENLGLRTGYAIAVNFPYMLHHMPDESVNTTNHRDRLLRLVKSLSPKVVTLLEQESYTNTSSFSRRFLETLDYYTAMFESIDVARHREDPQRISAEQHCVARDIVNVIACEEAERVERHEPLKKWRFRFQEARFMPLPLSSTVTNAVNEVLSRYSGFYHLEHIDGALYLYWKNRPMVTSSAWR